MMNWLVLSEVVNDAAPGVVGETETSASAGFWLVVVTPSPLSNDASKEKLPVATRLEPTVTVPPGEKMAAGLTVIATTSDVSPAADAVTFAVHGSEVVPPCAGRNVALTCPIGMVVVAGTVTHAALL